MSQESEQKPAAPLKRRRRWYQFGISSLLLLTLAVAMVCAWVVPERRAQQRKAAVLKQIVDWGGHYEAHSKYWPWVDRLLGVKCLEVTQISFDIPSKESPFSPDAPEPAPFDRDLRWLAAFPELESLSLAHKRAVYADGLDEIAKLRRLKKLTLRLLLTPEQAHRLNGLAHVPEVVLTTNVSQLLQEKFPGLTGLTELRIVFPMPGEPIEVRGFPALGELTAGGFNYVPSITVEDLPQLEKIKLLYHPYHAYHPNPLWGYSGICDQLALRRLPKLMHAKLSSKFKQITIGGAAQMQKLDFGYPGPFIADEPPVLAEIQLTDCGAITTLHGTRIRIAGKDWKHLDKLTELALYNSALPELSKDQWTKLNVLEFNGFRYRGRTGVVTGEPALDLRNLFAGAESCERLQEFSLRAQGPVQWPATLPKFPKLSSFQLECTDLDQPLDWKDAPNLKTLELLVHRSWNSTGLELKELPKLTGFTIRAPHVRIDKINLRQMALLQRAEFELASCDQFEAADLPALTYLGFRNLGFADGNVAQLTQARIENVPMLTNLHLKNVSLAEDAGFGGSTALNFLNLNGVRFTSPLNLREQPQLAVVEICPLDDLPEIALEDLPRLQTFIFQSDYKHLDALRLCKLPRLSEVAVFSDKVRKISIDDAPVLERLQIRAWPDDPRLLAEKAPADEQAAKRTQLSMRGAPKLQRVTLSSVSLDEASLAELSGLVEIDPGKFVRAPP